MPLAVGGSAPVVPPTLTATPLSTPFTATPLAATIVATAITATYAAAVATASIAPTVTTTLAASLMVRLTQFSKARGPMTRAPMVASMRFEW